MFVPHVPQMWYKCGTKSTPPSFHPIHVSLTPWLPNYSRTQASLSIVKLNNQVIRYRTYLFDSAADTIAMFVESIGNNSE